jgi:DNA-binding LacI/PurR family transcriptional regulator
MGANLKDVAAAAGVDTSTVSRALRGDGRISQATIARVRAEAERLGYRPNVAARRLRSGSSETIWLLAPGLDTPRERQPAMHASSHLAGRGFELLIALLRPGEALSRLVDRLDRGLADGALIIPRGDQGAEELRRLVQRRFPLCCIDRWPRGLRLPVVTTDNVAAGGQMVDHLAAAGATRIAVDIPSVNAVLADRRTGALAAAARLGLPVVDESALPGQPADGLGLVANDQFTARTRLGTLGGGRAVVAVFDEWTGDPWPARSVVVAEQDFPAMAQRAADRVLDCIRDPSAWQARIEHVPLLRIERIDSTAG